MAFFGAGVSIGAGIPSWSSLLDRLGGTPDLTSEPYLENDPLTMAELLAHEIGSINLQDELRKVMRNPSTPSLIHCFLARLAQPVYITTNYDLLFENAWKQVYPGSTPIIITNDADFTRYNLDPQTLESRAGQPILLKIHGCASRDAEEMILTRSQYRRHYRTNKELFKAVRLILERRHTLFLGFGHRDPEVSRLVEDVIYRFENRENSASINPAFYSLQFDMKERTPEVFAARGIVALQPPLALDVPKDFDYRGAGLCKALVDLTGAMDATAHEKLDLDTQLEKYVKDLSSLLNKAMSKLKDKAQQLSQSKSEGPSNHDLLVQLQGELGSLAGQGIYLLQENGDIIDYALPDGLTYPDRKKLAGLASRFYVRQAKTYRRPFVSDSDASKFNGQSTIFLCHPLGSEMEYKGLLFAAAQVGAWEEPVNMVKEFLQKHPDGSFVLVDSNGVALVPPEGRPTIRAPIRLPDTEEADVNMGFDYAELHRLSRRDRLVSRVWRNIVPLAQDDDVNAFSDLTMYSVVCEISPTRWKLALSVPLVR